jgi:hypothetical protein
MTTTPKKPQDHLPKGGDPDEKPAGWELLKPFDQVPVWDQTELIEIVKPILKDGQDEGSDEKGIDIQNFDVRIVGELAKKLQDFALDRDAFLAFVSGPGALERAISLGVAYSMQLGESERSANS